MLDTKTITASTRKSKKGVRVVWKSFNGTRLTIEIN
jgi:hypothetical protein